MNCPGVIYVSVMADGSIKVNGDIVAAESLDGTLASLKSKANAVWYYREMAGGSPRSAQSRAIGAAMSGIMAQDLPVSLSSKPDFSDYIAADGSSHARGACPGQN